MNIMSLAFENSEPVYDPLIEPINELPYGVDGVLMTTSRREEENPDFELREFIEIPVQNQEMNSITSI